MKRALITYTDEGLSSQLTGFCRINQRRAKDDYDDDLVFYIPFNII